MTNREKLNNTNIYDLLVEMNTKGCFVGCIIDMFTDHKVELCKSHERCQSCINDWLNSEVNPNDK